MTAPGTVPLSGRDLLAAIAAIAAWGLNFVAMKVGLRDFTPFQLGAARFLFSFLPLAIWIRPPSIRAGWVVAYGLLQGVGQFAFLFTAMKIGMTAALASVLMQTQVFVTALLGATLLGERIGRPLKIGLALAALGLACFAIDALSPEPATAGVATMSGIALTLLGATMWAGSNVVVRKLDLRSAKHGALSLIVWSSAVSAAGLALLSAIFDDASTRWTWTGASAASWLAIAYLSGVATVLAYALWTSLLERHPASRVAPFSLGVPVIGMLAGVLVLDERVSGWQWAGAALVMSALAFVARAGARRR